jgi:hypothetical protein
MTFSPLSARARRTTAGTAAALSLVSLGVAVHHSSPERKALEVLTPAPESSLHYSDEMPEPVAPESPAATPTETASVAPTAPVKTVVASAVDDSGMVLPPPCEGPDAMQSCPDGIPGWWAGMSSCSVVSEPGGPSGAPPVEGMSMTLELDAERVAPGGALAGHLTVTNATAGTVTFSASYEPAAGPQSITALVYGDGGGGGVLHGDVLVMDERTLAPGQSWSLDVAVPTTTCGDTYDDPSTPLPAGSYQATAGFFVYGVRVEPAPSATPTSEAEPSPSASPAADPSPSASPAEDPSPSASPDDEPSPAPSGPSDPSGWFAAATFTIS